MPEHEHGAGVPESIRINLLGTPGLGESGGPTAKLGKKPAALIALLSSPPGKRNRREELAALLWPSRFEEQARQSLRQSLTAIRKKLTAPDALCTEEGEIWLDPAKVSTDVASFETAAAGKSTEDLKRAVDLYKGDFISGLVSLSSEFDEWASLERTRLKNLAISAHEKLLAHFEQSEKNDDAIALAQRLLKFDPGNETAHRALMAAYAAAGRPAAALRQFELCKATLSSQSDASPEPATEAMANEIRRQEGDISSLSRLRGRALGATAAFRQSFFRPRNYIAAAFIFVLLAAGAVALFRQQPPAPAQVAVNACGDFDAVSRGDMPSLMVLPISASFADRDFDDSFPIVLQEALRSALLMVAGVAIVEGPPNGQEDLSLSVRDVARKHGVTHVLKGSIRPWGGAGSLRLWLTEAESGRIVWESANTFDLNALNSEQLENQAILEVTRAVQFYITDGPQTLRYQSYSIADIETFRLITKAYALINSLNPSNVELARSTYRAAMELNPEDPGALNGYAMSYLIPVLVGWSENPEEDLDTAAQYAQQLLAINPDFPYLYSTLGLLALIKGDHENAVRLGRKAIQLSENNSDGAIILAFILTFTNEPGQAENLARRAISLRPYTTPIWQKWALARTMRMNGNPKGAAECLKSTGAAQSGLPFPSLEYVAALTEAGDLASASNAVAMMQTVMGETNLSARRYCQWPPYANPAVQGECVSALARAGIPE